MTYAGPSWLFTYLNFLQSEAEEILMVFVINQRRAVTSPRRRRRSTTPGDTGMSEDRCSPRDFSTGGRRRRPRAGVGEELRTKVAVGQVDEM
ncbi:hypothetical protein EVAR_54854_1 [Eumeta japonica]|uniref:Uncharacterized protein n=1 Tax=Eumeta variegata TaxID=151549 RepID=A0A4C1YG82_EUMVA|nr:hypothetical protein EVAR_54854_1 [Eumeta japonica]